MTIIENSATLILNVRLIVIESNSTMIPAAAIICVQIDNFRRLNAILQWHILELRCRQDRQQRPEKLTK